jgi:hypothetical protein
MTHLDDVELGRRLKALRVEPPQATDFEARLGERLLALEQGDTTPKLAGRVIVGPWLRRGPVRLIGATALLLAGAAAAMEGGVVEWVQARVFQRAEDGARPAPPPAEAASADLRRARLPRPERAPLREVTPAPPEVEVEVTPVPAVALDIAPARPESSQPLERQIQPSRRESEATLRPRREALVRERAAAGDTLRPSRASDEPIRVPRVAIERRWSERSDSSERHFERRLPQLEPRDTQRPLEHLREVARQRRERGAGERGSGQRTPSLERLRERRERVIERRDASGERDRRDGERRERGSR